MLLDRKTAIIYGGAGAIGSSVAHAFAREGAHVFLAGRTEESLSRVVEAVRKEGGVADYAVVDALDKERVEQFQDAVVENAGSLDISFNVIGLDDVQGSPLTAMAEADFIAPIAIATRTQFLTATAAARQMEKNRAGVILAMTAQVGRAPSSNSGGFGVACAAIEGFFRQLACEVGPQGVRVVCLRSAGSPDAPGVDEVFRQHAANAGITREDFERKLAEGTLLKRLPRLAEVANAAAFAASDKASAITGAILNVTCGEIAD
ncbi:MAG: SDR family oxidoreductase [Chloroflexota bacterium]|nr:SDR family oxidoreductase [Chloroflexota bacterium]